MQKNIILSLLIVHLMLAKAFAISIKENNINFGVVYSKESSVKYVHIHNEFQKSINFRVQCSDTLRFKCLKQGWITLAPGADDSIGLTFSPIHNISYNATVVIMSDAPMGYHYALSVAGQGRYRDTYYSATENKSEQELKNILKSIITKNYTSIGYNTARDKMYMVIDNMKTNGQGASSNTLECIYTGRQISGYTSRQDAQSATYNFNTEHTWPQSLFNSAEPMLSDLHHIFTTDNTANNVRGNDPFGIVTNPSWTVGGSKAISGTFEPRDQQKARSARAILYFSLRYQNYSNYLNQMEQVLRAWHHQIPPSKQDSLRNEAIFGLQKNRNPLIDHPEFVDRITSFSDSSYARSDSSAWLTGNDMVFSLTESHALDSFRIYIINQGNTDLLVGNFVNTNNKLQFNQPSKILKPGQSFEMPATILYDSTRRVYQDSLVFNFGQKLYSIRYQVTSNLGKESILELPICPLYPNPASHEVYLDIPVGKVVILDLRGSLVSERTISQHIIDISDLPPGMYVVRSLGPDKFKPSKLLIAR